MEVSAFNTPRDPAWRWRIVNYAGDVIAESGQGFASIHSALLQGKDRLAAMNHDQSQAVGRLNGRRHSR